jgi:class 3 adenylate cyclase
MPAERKLVSVLFADLVGSTAQSGATGDRGKNSPK